MLKQYRDEMFPLLRDFTNYIVTVSGKSQKTADEYFLDLRHFFRYMKWYFGEASELKDLSEQDAIEALDCVSILDIDISFIKKIKLTDVYEFLNYLSRDRANRPNSNTSGCGLMASSRARKVSAIRAFFKYLEKKARLLEENPINDLEIPKKRQSMIRYLSLDESRALLSHIEGEFRVRDYCIITLFLNCGLRVSELCGINLDDIREDMLRVVGKGNKERVVYLSDACIAALDAYLPERERIKGINPHDHNALFISKKKNRISTETVKWLVKKYCAYAGLDSKISAHKLRHTSATLMYRNGVDVRVLQEILGHKHINTTEIYTHVDQEDMRTAARANPLSSIKPDDDE